MWSGACPRPAWGPSRPARARMSSATPPSSPPARAARRTPKRGHRGRFPLTREGWWFLGATVLVGLGALNAGLNLLFAVWGMMLFLVAASGVLSELGLRGLEIRRVPPPVIHAGLPYLM